MNFSHLLEKENMENYSVLMSVYAKDNPIFLKQAIESVFAQTVPTNDFVLVEDGRLTDEIYLVINEYKNKFPQLKIESYDKNKGLAYALNYGLKACKNRLVARMDADDISAPNRCEKQLKRFEQNPKLVVVGTAMVEFEDNINNILSKKMMPGTYNEIKLYARRRSPFNHPSVMYDKNIIINSFGGYNVHNLRAEDFELFTDIVFNNYECENINENLFFYRTNLQQIKRRFNFVSFKSIIRTQYYNYRKKYISFNDLFYVFLAQSFGLICPGFILKRIMVRHFRT